MTTRSPLDAGWNGAKVLVLSPTPTHPQNYGNRKRIYEVCSNLKKQGAQIAFVHYPAEHEWRARLQISAEAAMTRAWDRYYVVPVSRELHSPPRASHHTIDEWWDDAIGLFLKWIFSIEKFDVFIVNYTWLSKALQFAPPQVVTILDTHDRFAGRKELLASNGIVPEYFYTSQEEETVGLGRADIVWAIKDGERQKFEHAIKKPVLTMLHLDDCPLLPTTEVDAEGYLRVGIIGARNSVNVTNICGFLSTVIPIFYRYFAPIKLIIGGSVCDLLEDVDPRFVVLLGEISDVGEFYRSIDVACVPMSFSTGLKIKVGEAISRGFPVVSLSHAFEGYPAQHPFHVLKSFEEMAEGLVTISFERTLLQDLRLGSVRAREETARGISKNLRKTWQAIQAKRKFILYCVHSSALQPNGAFRAALESTLQYLTLMSEVIVMVVDGPIDKITATTIELGTRARVLVASELTVDRNESSSLEYAGFEVVTIQEAVLRFNPDIIVADALTASMADTRFSAGTLIYRAEMIAQICPVNSAFDASRIAEQFRRVIAVGVNRSRSLAALGCALGADVLLAPCMWRSERLPARLRGGRRRARYSVAILGPDHVDGTEVICELLRDLGCRPLLIGSKEMSGGSPNMARHATIWEYLDELFDSAKRLPHFVIDGSFGALGFQFAREILQRLGVPLITIGHRFDQPAITGRTPRGYATTTSDLFEEVVSALACVPGTPSEETSAIDSELASDGGWACLWNYVTKLRNGQFEEFI